MTSIGLHYYAFSGTAFSPKNVESAISAVAKRFEFEFVEIQDFDQNDTASQVLQFLKLHLNMDCVQNIHALKRKFELVVGRKRFAANVISELYKKRQDDSFKQLPLLQQFEKAIDDTYNNAVNSVAKNIRKYTKIEDYDSAETKERKKKTLDNVLRLYITSCILESTIVLDTEFEMLHVSISQVRMENNEKCKTHLINEAIVFRAIEKVLEEMRINSVEKILERCSKDLIMTASPQSKGLIFESLIGFSLTLPNKQGLSLSSLFSIAELSEVKFKCKKYVISVNMIGFSEESEYWEAVLNKKEEVMNVAVKLSNFAHPDVFLPILHDKKLYLLLFSCKLSTNVVKNETHRAGIESTDIDKMYKNNYKKEEDEDKYARAQELYQKLHPIILKLKNEASYILRIHVHVPRTNQQSEIDGNEAKIFINQDNINMLVEGEVEREVIQRVYVDNYVSEFKRGPLSKKDQAKIKKGYSDLEEFSKISKDIQHKRDTIENYINEKLKNK